MRRLQWLNTAVLAVAAFMALLSLTVLGLLWLYQDTAAVSTELPRMTGIGAAFALLLIAVFPAWLAQRRHWRSWPLWQGLQLGAIVLTGFFLVGGRPPA